MPDRLLEIMGQQQARQVRIGSLWFDPARVEQVLHRYCKQLFVLTGSEQLPYQFIGSSTAVKIDSRHLILCCGHQIDAINPDKLAIIASHKTQPSPHRRSYPREPQLRTATPIGSMCVLSNTLSRTTTLRA
jgi:hypothetical protein